MLDQPQSSLAGFDENHGQGQSCGGEAPVRPGDFLTWGELHAIGPKRVFSSTLQVLVLTNTVSPQNEFLARRFFIWFS